MSRFSCPDCDRVVEVSDDSGGLSMVCPTCGRTLRVPASAAADPCPTARPRVSAEDKPDRGMVAIDDCPECGKSMQVAEEDVGRRVVCPRCGQRLVARVPRDRDRREDDVSRREPYPVVLSVEEEDRPQRKSKRSARKYCAECGSALPRRAKFCSDCGTPRSEQDAVLADANNKKTTAGILAILVGSLGVHKFFLGYTTAGVIMLLVTVLTCGIGGIVMHVISIVEGVTYLTKSDEDFSRIYLVEHKDWF